MSDIRAKILCDELIGDITRHEIILNSYKEALLQLRKECNHDYVPNYDAGGGNYICTICGQENKI